MNVNLNEDRFLKLPNLNGFSWGEDIPTKLTFRIIDGILYFFIDERFIHSREVIIDKIDKINILEDANNSFDKIIISEIL